MALLALLLLAHTAAGVYAPQLLRGIVDELTARGASVALAHAAAWFLAVATLRQLSRGAAAVIGENVSWIATNRVRIDLVRHTLGLDPGFVTRHPPGRTAGAQSTATPTSLPPSSRSSRCGCWPRGCC